MLNATLPELWSHQRQGIDKAKKLLDENKNYFALFYMPGTGKTRTMLEILRDIYKRNDKIIPTIIFTPPVVIGNWKNEILKYTKIKEDRIVLLNGSQVERVEQIKSANPNSIFVTNYQSLLMVNLYKELVAMARKTPTVLILDESHRCKTFNSKSTKEMIKLSDLCVYKYLLTGTPITNELTDFWAQYRIMDGGRTFGDSFYAFRNRYYRNVMQGRNVGFPKYVAVPGAELEVREKIQGTSLFADKADCLDLPDFVQKTVEVELSPEQRRIYNEMKRDMIATITTQQGDTKVSIAQLAITKSLRMLQVLSGHIPIQHEDTNEQTVMKIKDNPRKDALKDILEDLTLKNKCVIWAIFKDNYTDIMEVCEKLKLKYVTLTGETKNRQESIDSFNNDPEIKVLIGNPKAGGIGVSLIAASYAVYYSRSYSLEDDVQSEARNYRSGSEIHKKITRVDLVAKNTLDEIVLSCLASKQKLSDQILKERINEL